MSKHLILLVLLAAAQPALAQDYQGVAFAGGSAGDGRSAYAGTVVALPGASLGKGLAVRGSVNAGNYRYETGIGQIDAEYRGAEAAIVYQLSGDWGWTNLAVGPRVSKLQLTPDDPENERRGTTWDLGLHVDGAQQLGSDWRLDYLGSVGTIRGAYQTRIGLGRTIEKERQSRLGIEGAVQGDPRYTTASGGVFAATRLAKDFEAQLSVGGRHQEGRKLKPYASLGVKVPARLEEVRNLAAWVCERARQAGLSTDGLIDLELAVVEAANNIVLHGYSGKIGTIRCSVSLAEKALEVTLVDIGRPIPQTKLKETRLPETGEDHGRGLNIIRACVDELHYNSSSGTNCLTLLKKLAG